VTKSKKPDSLLKVWDRQNDDEDRKRLGLPPNRDEENQMEEENERPQAAKRSTISLSSLHHKKLKFIAVEAGEPLNTVVDRVFDRLFEDFEGMNRDQFRRWTDKNLVESYKDL